MAAAEGESASSLTGGIAHVERGSPALQDDARRLDDACNWLSTAHPDHSIRQGLLPSQRTGLRAAAGFLATVAIMESVRLAEVATLCLSLLFATVILLRVAAAILALIDHPPVAAPRSNSGPLPIVTILIPLYREANMVKSLVQAIQNIDYPPHLLDVKLLLEADDPLTIAAVHRARLAAPFETLILPGRQPRTKPKALNFGLASARGEIVCVYDAEDRPSPHQLRQAVNRFEADAGHLAVVQAPLLTHNGAASWIAGQFQIEYAVHFRVWLPFLQRMGWPLPLGGTSNYFRRSMLVAAGGWDPWNVTEDADLGFRLARLGGRAAMIDAPTMEEGPSRISHWMGQRTRWMKGHIQTWLVLMRHPIRAAREIGLPGFIGLQLTFGASLITALAHLPLLALVVIGVALPAVSLENWHAALFGIGYGSVLAAVLATREVRLSFWRLITLPLYWPLMSIAMYLALVEMKTKPHAWAKTPHGVSGPS